MKFVDKDRLPVEILDKELPKDNSRNYEMFYDYKIRTNGGFVDAVFLASIMLTCFLWGMLIILFIK